jgi:hypothetical protein
MRQKVQRGYHDMLRMAGLLNPFLVIAVNGEVEELPPGPMENRFFAIGDDDKSNTKRDLISSKSYKLGFLQNLIYLAIIQQSALWYPWYPFVSKTHSNPEPSQKAILRACVIWT